jgi:uncharacterized protein
MYSVVLDTVVFVRSLINPHGLWGQLVFQHASSYRLILSKPVAQEVLEVLHRPELTRKFRSLAHMDTHRVISLLAQAESVKVRTVPALSRDPKDNKFLATAAAGKADYLVSEDEDLLILKEYKGVQIIDAQSFLRVLEHASR